MAEDELSVLRIQNAELKTQVAMYQKMLEMAMSYSDRTDANLKLSIQTPSSGRSNVSKADARTGCSKPLIATLNANLTAIPDAKLQCLLEAEPVATSSLLHIVDSAIRGPHSEGTLLIQCTTPHYCKYLDEDGTEHLDPIVSVFDEVCKCIFQRCAALVSMLTDQLQSLPYNEADHIKDNNRYSNTMAFNDTKVRKRLLKETTHIMKQ